MNDVFQWTARRIDIGRHTFGATWNPEEATGLQRAIIAYIEYSAEEDESNGQRA